MGLGHAHADVDVEVLVENLTTGESGSSVSAASGEQVALQLTLTNSGADQKVDITVVAGTVECTHEVSVNRHFKAGQTFTKRVKGRIPASHRETLVVDASALAADGCSDSDSGSLDFGVGKVGNGSSSRGSVFQRMFTRMIARGLLETMSSDREPVASTFGEVKHLFQ
jgi:hypothetical protein